jgi:hypothetical protein
MWIKPPNGQTNLCKNVNNISQNSIFKMIFYKIPFLKRNSWKVIPPPSTKSYPKYFEYMKTHKIQDHTRSCILSLIYQFQDIILGDDKIFEDNLINKLNQKYSSNIVLL